MSHLSVAQALKLIAKAQAGDVRAASTVLRALVDDPGAPSESLLAEILTALGYTPLTLPLDGADIADGVITYAHHVSGVIRERLTANRTYYVRADGSDANTGLVDSAGGAFLTIQQARTAVRDAVDLNGFTITVQVKDGTYTGGYTQNGMFVGQTSGSQFVIQGNSGTPGNVIISTTSAHAMAAGNGARFVVKDMRLQTTTSGEGILSENLSHITFSNIEFGAVAGTAHLFAQRSGILEATGNYAITGDCARHVNCQQNATVDLDGRTVTIAAARAFSAEFVRASNLGNVDADGMTFSGAGVAGTTGQEYDVSRNAVVDTAGGGAGYFPGSIAGATATGGQYV